MKKQKIQRKKNEISLNRIWNLPWQADFHESNYSVECHFERCPPLKPLFAGTIHVIIHSPHIRITRISTCYHEIADDYVEQCEQMKTDGLLLPYGNWYNFNFNCYLKSLPSIELIKLDKSDIRFTNKLFSLQIERKNRREQERSHWTFESRKKSNNLTSFFVLKSSKPSKQWPKNK